MKNTRNLKLKIDVKGLDKYRNKLMELGWEFEKLKYNMNKIDDIIEEINQMELVVDTGIDREKSSQ